MTEKEDWCPTQGGSTTAYEPEFRRSYFFDGKESFTKWYRVPTQEVHSAMGIPSPLDMGGVFKTIGLFGYEQAQALAWTYAATAAAQGVSVEVRIVAYELQYDIKARKLDDTPNAQ